MITRHLNILRRTLALSSICRNSNTDTHWIITTRNNTRLILRHQSLQASRRTARERTITCSLTQNSSIKASIAMLVDRRLTTPSVTALSLVNSRRHTHILTRLA